MDFATASDQTATIALLVGTLMAAGGFGCIGFTFLIRIRSERAQRHRDAAALRWERTIFKATSMFESDEVSQTELDELKREALERLTNSPDFEKVDLPLVLHEWNYIHESLIGDSKRGLNVLADHLDLFSLAVKLLSSTSIDKRLLAMNTLGNLADERAYPEIEKILADRDPVVSSWAWRALFRIDLAKTIDKHLLKIAEREDWSPIFIARVIHEINADDRSVPLCRLVEKCFADGLGERQMSRLISYLSLSHVSDHSEIVNRILLESNETEVLIACLRLINSDDDLTKIRSLLYDDRWQIRMQVGLTLGRLGHEDDVPRLIELLDDPDWWVRYRTATALMSMPGMTKSRARSLTKTLPNQFARDILRQVLAEMQITCFPQTSLTLSR